MEDYFRCLQKAMTEQVPQDLERKFTPDEALRFQNQLLSDIASQKGQIKVWEANAQTGGEIAPLEELLGKFFMTNHLKVIQKYGFDGTEQGAALSIAAFTPECLADPRIVRKREFVQYLLSPEWQKELQADKDNSKCPWGVCERRRQNCDPNVWDEDDLKALKLWLCIGGKSSGGIVVRREASGASAAFGQKLHTGSLVQQEAKQKDRLKYSLVAGEGPDIGWVSVTLKDMTLMKKFLDYSVPKEVVKEDENLKTFIVCADRVAQRDTPSKDGAMLGVLTKGAIVKGTVVSEEVLGRRIDWVTFKGKDTKGDMVDKFMLIDGASVGLGKLLDEQKPVKKTTWKVVHDRVAQREIPDKEGKMLGAALKDQEFKGKVVSVNDVRWLSVEDGKVTKYLMINGESVGLGELLQRVKLNAKAEEAKEDDNEEDNEEEEKAE